MCLAIPGKIVAIQDQGLARTAEVDFGGLVRSVNLGLVPEAALGDYVIVHVGVAISRLDEDAARETLAMLEQLAGGRVASDSGPR